MTVETTVEAAEGPRRLRRLTFEPNPVLVKELRARFRSRRSFLTVSAFVGLLALAGLLVYASQVEQATQNFSYSMYSYYSNQSLGEPFASMIMSVELILVMLIAPALTMNALSGERDRRTYELLMATPLSGWAILRGKFLAALAYILLLVFAVLPVLSLAFLFGGVSASQVLGSQVIVVASGVLLLMVGLFWSSWLKSSGRSAVASYFSVAMVSFGHVFILYIVFAFFGIFMSMSNSTFDFDRLLTFMFSFSPVGTWMSGSLFGGNALGSGQLTSLNWWLYSLGPPVIFSTILFLLAGMRIRPAGRRPKLAVLALLWLLIIWTKWAWDATTSGSQGFP